LCPGRDSPLGAGEIGPNQVTDAYLLALAVAHDGCLVTLDRRIGLAVARRATAAHLVVLPLAPDLLRGQL
jgi:predicted nucleic acid-binding protein